MEDNVKDYHKTDSTIEHSTVENIPLRAQPCGTPGRNLRNTNDIVTMKTLLEQIAGAADPCGTPRIMRNTIFPRKKYPVES